MRRAFSRRKGVWCNHVHHIPSKKESIEATFVHRFRFHYMHTHFASSGEEEEERSKKFAEG